MTGVSTVWEKFTRFLENREHDTFNQEKNSAAVITIHAINHSSYVTNGHRYMHTGTHALGR
jgi:hypothetical protein